MDINAKGLRVLVTAGAAGIGKVIAETFQANGARVFTCDVAQGPLEEFKKSNPAIGAMLADVADAKQVDRLFEEAGKFLGGLDVMVNNAGIAGPTAKVEDVTPEEWERTLAVNLNGMFYCTRRAVPLLKAAGGGSVINLSSSAGRLGFALRSPYCTAKFGVVGFTESLAIELGPSNIRVNDIQPGIVEGDRINRVIDAKSKALGMGFEEFKQQLLSKVSLRRMVTAQDIANTILFLCSDAGKNISGQSVPVCGNVETLN
jgi:NAD(P)-dependent dehydrogenase (short-subunit alcohol dehydrogenase family)